MVNKVLDHKNHNSKSKHHKAKYELDASNVSLCADLLFDWYHIATMDAQIVSPKKKKKRQRQSKQQLIIL